MEIPISFKLTGIPFKVEIVETIQDGTNYGVYLESSQKILLAQKALEEDKLVNISKELMCSTFCHELIHAFQSFYNNDFDEIQAQCLGNLLFEFLTTSEFIAE